MFNVIGMIGNYPQRLVDVTKVKSAVVDTVSVTDGSHPYETAVSHPEYNDDRWIVVEAYDTREEAQEGHNKWVDIMSSDDLPDKLVDCCNAEISKFLDPKKMIFYRKKGE